MPRYAIYYLPEQTSPLWGFGSAAIGYDAYSGERVSFPDHPIYHSPNARAWTQEPRRYGFHGTLKAPFELSAGADELSLLALARKFAAERSTVTIPELAVRTIGSFIALVPAIDLPDLHDLAADCVRDFDGFRLPLSPEDRKRRLKAPLSPRQVEHLDTWGYPYVLDEFRFHMTLSGALDDGPRAPLRDALATLYADIAASLTIDGISVCKQASRDSRFVVLERFPFGG
jgi:putative phosphonate metabolism protein